MSKKSKVLLGIFFLGLVVFVVTRLVVLLWNPWMYTPLAISIAALVGAISIDFKQFVEFMTLKTTKKGLDMGTVIVLFIALLVAINYIGSKHNHKKDFTEEKLYSLSDQTKEILKGLDSDLYFKGFFRKGKPEHDQVKARLKAHLRLYRQASSNVKAEFFDPIAEPALAKEYEMGDVGGLVVEYKGKRSKPDKMTEEELTNAIIKVTRTSKKALYFLSGHDELSLEDEKGNGAKVLNQELLGASYEVKNLNLVETGGEVPSGADAVFVLGPKVGLLEGEIAALKNYLFKGGSLLLAIDPGVKTGVESFLAELGVKYKGDFVIDQAAGLFNETPITAVGMKYSESSEITKKLPRAMSLFFMASGLEKTSPIPTGFTVEELVQTGPSAVSTSKLARQVEVKEKGPFTLAMSVRGKLKDGEKEGREFSVVVFSDSDIFSNERLYQQVNRDLVLNSVAFLAKDEDLINVRPKAAKQTVMAGLTNTKFMLFNVIPFFGFPLLLILFGGWIYYVRRSA